MKQIQRVNVIMSAVILSFIPAALFAGFTSIPIRQDPRFISNYNSNSTSTYWDRLIVETISDEETWVAWVSEIDSQNCRIYRYNWDTENRDYIEYNLESEIVRWRLWERLPCCFAFIEGPEGRIPIYWEEDQLSITDMKSCIALDLNGDPHVYVAVVVDIFAYTLEQHGHEPAAHISFIDVWDLGTTLLDPQLVDCSGYVGALPGELGSLDVPLNYLEPERRGGLFIHQSPTGRPV